MQRLKTILLDDELGICTDLEREMNELVGTYVDEWKAVVDDPERRRQFRQFVNTVGGYHVCAAHERVLMVHIQDEHRLQTEVIKERGQERPANWPKQSPPTKLHESVIVTPKSEWEWRKLATVYDLMPTNDATTWVPVHLRLCYFI